MPEIKQFRKKPVVVEAVQLIDDLRNHTAIATWITVNGGDVDVPFAEPCLYIETLEGRMRAGIGDWVAKGVKGEFHPVRGDIFAETYEPVTAKSQDVCPSCGQRGGPYCEPSPYAKRVRHEAAGERPRIVCLCGSTRFGEAFREANLRLTLEGVIVLSIGCDMKTDADLAAAGALGKDPETVKRDLDDLHKRKIDLADEVLVVSRDGYFGQSTAGEISYAVAHGKPVRFAEDAARERALAAGLVADAVGLAS